MNTIFKIILAATAALWIDCVSTAQNKVASSESPPAVGNSVTAVNVKAFGATGDGVTDDWASIRTAIIGSTNRSLFFPAGVYAISKSLPLVQGVRILGEGAGGGYYSQSATLTNPPVSLVQRSGQSVIFLMPGANCPIFINDTERAEALRTEESVYDRRGKVKQFVYNAELRDIVLHGNGRSQTRYNCDLVSLTDAWSIHFQNVHFAYPAGYFVRAWNCNVLRFGGCVFEGESAKSKGILLYDTADSLISGGNMGGGVIGPFLWIATPTGWLNNVSGSQFGDTKNSEVGGLVTSIADNVMKLSEDPCLETGDPFVFYTHSFTNGILSKDVKGGEIYFAVRLSSTNFGFNRNLLDARAGKIETISDSGREMWIKPGPNAALYLSQATRNTFSGMRFDNGHDGCVILEEASNNNISDSIVSKPGYNAGRKRLDRVGLWIRSGVGNIIHGNIFTECTTPIRVDIGGNHVFANSPINCTSNSVYAASTRQYAQVDDGDGTLGAALSLPAVTSPPSATKGQIILFNEMSGAKSILRARFPNGTIQTIVTEP